MAAIQATAQVSATVFSGLTFLPISLRRTGNVKRTGTRCAFSTSGWQESRRFVSISVVLSHLLLLPNQAVAGNLLDNYVKRKKLDPLEAYVPPIILAQFQIKDLERTLDAEKLEFENCRILLRSGPTSSLRVNVRAVAQYASDAGNGKAATDDVDHCLRALEELDSLFLRASRKDTYATVKSMKAQIVTALGALDSLLQTVPSEVLDKSKVMAETYRSSEDTEVEEVSDPKIKQLESIL